MCGRTAQAEKAMSQLRALNPNLSQANLNELLPLRRPQDIALWAEGLRRAGLPA
jgi:hypothetical protein